DPATDTERNVSVPLSSSCQTCQAPSEAITPISQPSQSADTHVDALTTWTDPISHKTYQINARTGNVILPKQSSSSYSSGSVTVSLDSHSVASSAKRLRLAAPTKTDEPSPFIREILEVCVALFSCSALYTNHSQKWKNPAYT